MRQPQKPARRVPLTPQDKAILGVCGTALQLEFDKVTFGERTQLDSNIDNLEFQIKGERFNLRLIKYELVK